MQNKETRLYDFGGYVVRIDGPAFPEREYLSVFRVADGVPDTVFEIVTVPGIPTPEGVVPEKDTYQCRRGDTVYFFNSTDMRIFAEVRSVRDDFCAVRLSPFGAKVLGSSLIVKILNLPERMLRRGAIFLHASFVRYEGKAILFTAPKQTGKSTQAALWEKYRGAEVVNGDRALLVCRDGQWFACGSPYCGSSKICANESLPLRAIVSISQAKENRARRARVREAMSAMMDGCSYDAADRAQIAAVMEIAGKVITSVPFYKLECTPDEGAVKELEGVL